LGRQTAAVGYHAERILPVEWEITDQESGQIVSSKSWSGGGDFAVAWTKVPPFVLHVTWMSEAGSFAADWPVNMAEPELPPPSELAESLAR
jgi:hypothetical protein